MDMEWHAPSTKNFYEEADMELKSGKKECTTQSLCSLSVKAASGSPSKHPLQRPCTQTPNILHTVREECRAGWNSIIP